MKRSKFSEAQIAFVLKQVDDRTSVGEVCRKAGISEATFYNWRKKYAGLMPSEMRRPRQLEDENSKLKRLVADLSLDCGSACKKDPVSGALGVSKKSIKTRFYRVRRQLAECLDTKFEGQRPAARISQ